MLTICFGGFAAGAWVVMPPDDVDPVTTGQLVVEGPGAVTDSQGSATFQALGWAETHDDKYQPRVIPFPMQEPRLPALAPHAVRVRVMFLLDRSLSSSAPVELHFDLPDSAAITLCRGVGSDVSWNWLNRPQQGDFNALLASIFGVRLNKSYLRVSGEIKPGSSFLSFVMDVQGVDGLSMVTNRTRARVRFPVMLTVGGDPTSRGKDQKAQERAVLLTEGLAAPEKYTWSQRPIDQRDDSELWVQPWSSDDENSSDAPITGVREDLLRHDSRQELWAGIVFGVAGAAAIGFVQSVFARIRKGD